MNKHRKLRELLKESRGEPWEEGDIICASMLPTTYFSDIELILYLCNNAETICKLIEASEKLVVAEKGKWFSQDDYAKQRTFMLAKIAKALDQLKES